MGTYLHIEEKNEGLKSEFQIFWQNGTDPENSTISISNLKELRESLKDQIEFSWGSYRRFSSFRFDMVICLTILFLVVFLILCCASGIDKRNSELELREARLRARVQMLEQSTSKLEF